MRARWEKHCTGARCLTGGLPGDAKNWGNFYHAYVEFCFVPLAADARLCTNHAPKMGKLFITPMWKFCLVPLATDARLCAGDEISLNRDESLFHFWIVCLRTCTKRDTMHDTSSANKTCAKIVISISRIEISTSESLQDFCKKL